MIAHWDEVEGRKLEVGPMGLTRIDLGDAIGSRTVGVARLVVDPGKRTSPVHVEMDEEEIFYVLSGSGLSWQEGKTYEAGAGDCIVHLAQEESHTLIAGPEGIDALAFGERTDPTLTYLPRAGVARAGITLDVSIGASPWTREAEAGELEVPEPSERPANIVSREAAESAFGGIARFLGKSAGAVRTGLNLVALPPSAEGAPPHCHSAEEEIFVVLEGEGVLRLWPGPSAEAGEAAPSEEIPLRPGHVISRPPGTRVSHSLHSGEQGLTYLAYGTRNTSDICFYPRSKKVFFRGVGLIARLEHLEYHDGEPS